ncbi:MAG: UDP-N-acetylmuramoyl-tripeptide--D-alanyl-D-alanine ligase [Chloroflexota bacterium]|nr:UDP-N-acetylmuramoyl-tripeptide--D-alanyl-D-alanine ligase [Chloroflexota bacterium]
MTAHLTTDFLRDVLIAAGADVHFGGSAEIRDGVADSRQVQPGALFAAFRGERLDGNDFVDEAFDRGAPAVVCDRAPQAAPPGRTLAVADDTRAAMARLASAWRQACGTAVVGITGTVGKTSAKELTAATLARRLQTHRSKENYNSFEGLPLALMSLRRDHEVSVLEMAMDRRGEIAQLCAIAKPRIGVVLNIGATHAEKVGTIDDIAREKLSLVRSLPPDGTALLNADDPRVLAARDSLPCRVLTFGVAPEADLRARNIRDEGLEGVAFEVAFGKECAAAHSPLPGVHTLPAALTALGVCLALGISLGEAAGMLSQATPAGRMVPRRGKGGWLILDDRYNASPASVEGALRFLAAREGRRIAFLGGMAELGAYSESEHRRIGRVVAECCDLAVVSGELAMPLADEAEQAGAAVVWFATKEEAAAWLAPRLRAGDVVLVKASRGQAFETVIPRLEEGA